MKRVFSDLHIHIGRTYKNQPVKITASRNLTFSSIVDFTRNQKGLQMIGIIDAHSPEVIEEIEMGINAGIIVEKKDGGLDVGGLTIILGSEIEINDEACKGPIHVLIFLPTIEKMKAFSHWMSFHMKNIHLSSQRMYVSGIQLQKKVKELEGLFIPAHVFTPFKSLYGKGVFRSLTEVFDPLNIDGIELGLSADTIMADQISELHPFSYLTNSDAHSLAKIAREYQLMEMKEASFGELKKVLHQEEGRRIIANYGLDPKLGKYYETVCAKCLAPFSELEGVCSRCGSNKQIKGVSTRTLELKDTIYLPVRPTYIHQVPLEYIPGLGKKSLEKLLHYFSTEMQIIHEAPYEAICEVVPQKIAETILAARTGNLSIHAGGGGKYGQVAIRSE